jgi:ubiquinone/menaquinone biosynthesis C-methylase UbiE
MNRSDTVSDAKRADYGVDAPGVIRNLLLVTVTGFLPWLTMVLGWWSGDLAGLGVRLPLGHMAIWPAAGCFFMAMWMLYDSKIGKMRNREQLLDSVRLFENARVLDVGCGRGLMLVGAAKRLTTGTASGIDLWQAEDLSGNRPEATMENAASEGVADRVDVQTADMRKMPFPDATFDVVVSCSAIHNIYDAPGRRQAIAEIARVLKPGGEAVIDDIRHGREYAASFAANGCTSRSIGSTVLAVFLAIVTMGSLRPVTLVVRKTS